MEIGNRTKENDRATDNHGDDSSPESKAKSVELKKNLYDGRFQPMSLEDQEISIKPGLLAGLTKQLSPSNYGQTNTCA